MKKIITTIGYTFIAGIFLFGFSDTSSAQQSCTIESMSFSEVPVKFSGVTTSLKIQTQGCSNGIQISAMGIQGLADGSAGFNKIYINDNPLKITPNQDGIIEANFELSTSGCYKKNRGDGVYLKDWGFECVNYLVIKDIQGSEIKSSYSSALTPEFVKSKSSDEGRKELRDKGILVGDCNLLGCDFGSSGPDDPDEDNWSFRPLSEGSSEGGTGGSSGCVLSNGEGPDDPSDVSFDTIEASSDTFVGKTGKLHIKTLENGCAGKVITVKLYTIVQQPTIAIPIGLYLWDLAIDVDKGSGRDYVTVQAPLDKDLYINYEINDYGCQRNTTDKDCLVYVKINDTGGTIFSSKKWIGNTYRGFAMLHPYSFDSAEFINKVHFKKGILVYNCNDTIDCEPIIGSNAWGVNGTNGKMLDKDGELPDPLIIEKLRQAFDPESPCYLAEGDLGNGKMAGPYNGYYKSDCYELLAPIPGIGKEGTTPGRFAIQNISQYKLGDYINTLFQVAMGILMLLAVVMIIVAGVEYMTVESIFGKSRAKQRITGALTGLILGFGIFIILRTINPALLEVNFGKDVDTVTLGFGPVADTQYLNSVDVAGIPDVDLNTMIQNEAFVIYIAHQQGKAGASAIFYSVKNGKNVVVQNPYYKNYQKIQANVDNQFKKPTALDFFLNYFYKRVKTFSNSPQRDQIPQEYTVAIKQASLEIGVDYETMITMCMIESYLCTKNVHNGQGYRGLFQFGKDAWAQYGKGDYMTNVFDPYENSLAAAKMFKDNIKIKDIF